MSRTDPVHCRRVRVAAFSLIELLTVIFIISLLIGVLIPSINSARNAAKKATTAKTIDAIKVALEMFKNDNEKDFRLTNGYPPSFAHPKIPGYGFDSYLGEFPFRCVSESTPPVVYGAHWLPAMLMGADALGYVRRASVPSTNNLKKSPWLWYPEGDCASGDPVRVDRQSFYLDPGNVRMKKTIALPGNFSDGFDAVFEAIGELPVIVDSFDQPILYYVARKHGKMTNMVEAKRLQDRNYNRGAPQQEGVPYYFHQDNEGFTGSGDAEAQRGWDFGGRLHRRSAAGNLVLHDIAEPGEDLTPDQLTLGTSRETFARYIIDRNMWTSLSPDSNVSQPMRPVNADSFLLISAGPDGLYGTNDDVSNMAAFPD